MRFFVRIRRLARDRLAAYNAAMGTTSAVEIDAWLRDGGIVVTASERAARSLAAAFHRARRAEGLTAWPTPNIQDWRSFARAAWDERGDRRFLDGRVVLSTLQEQSLWTRIVAHATPEAVEFAGTGDRLATLAMKAHHLLCDYAPQLLKDNARVGWDQDPGAFSGWLAAFNKLCHDGKLLSAARVPIEVIALLRAETMERPPVLLSGFDRMLPTQQTLFEAWSADGDVRQVALGATVEKVEFNFAADPAAELAACALWSKTRLASDPHARLLVITQDARTRRGEIERGFLRYLGADETATGASKLLEFSLGVPLGQVALARAARLLLRWLSDAIAENELDWLFSTDQIAASQDESRALTAFMRALRRRGLQRQRWTLAEFLCQQARAELPAAWTVRITQAGQRLQEFARQPQTPLAWAEFVPQLLEMAGWPGARALTSAEFQALRLWQQTVEACASLGFDGRRIAWSDFLAALDRATDETLFAPESQDAPILIAGPAESAGLTADAIWFLGASEEAWPAAGATHPLIPIAVQREAGMPHASAKLDWDLANAMTRRVLASAPEVRFSYARQSEGVEARPSRLVMQVGGLAEALPAEFKAPAFPDPMTIAFDDATQLPYPLREVLGGATVLSTQSQCPFKAFATARLDAKKWDAGEAGLSAIERGQLLHEVLHSVWVGPPLGIRNHAELAGLVDLAAFVEDHVRRVLREAMPARARKCMPPRYLELESIRLTGLITEWLGYERERVPFTVAATEADVRPAITGLTLKVRIDRIDRLNDDSLLVIDYKSGTVSPSSWDLPRPDDVQLPLYAGFALEDRPENVGGLVFAQIRAGEHKEFCGRVNDARATLMSSLSTRQALVKKPLTDDEMSAWRTYIEGMARDFVAGRAEVDPRDYPRTCERCGLQALCRIQEDPPQAEDEDGDGEEAGDA
jgi:ATP-dependent helicase/nuclease subunit B